MKWFPFVGWTAWGLLNTPLTAGSSGGGVGIRPPTSLLPTLLILRTGTQSKVVEDDNQVAFVGAEWRWEWEMGRKFDLGNCDVLAC